MQKLAPPATCELLLRMGRTVKETTGRAAGATRLNSHTMGANQQQERERAQAPPDGFFTLAWEDTEPSPHQGLASSLPGQTDPLLYGSGLQAAQQQAPISGWAWPQGSPDLPGNSPALRPALPPRAGTSPRGARVVAKSQRAAQPSW